MGIQVLWLALAGAAGTLARYGVVLAARHHDVVVAIVTSGGDDARIAFFQQQHRRQQQVVQLGDTALHQAGRITGVAQRTQGLVGADTAVDGQA